MLVLPSWWPCDTWNVVAGPSISRRYKMIIFNGRGAGRSSKLKPGYTISRFAAEGLFLLAYLSISRCHAVGFALGKQIVQAMAIERPELMATLTIAAVRPGAKTLSGGRRDLFPEAERGIRASGFEQYIRSHVGNDGMAFNEKFYRENRHSAADLSQTLWSGQSTVEQFCRHGEARLTRDTLAQTAEVKVPTLVLCGVQDDVNRRGSTSVNTMRS